MFLVKEITFAVLIALETEESIVVGSSMNKNNEKPDQTNYHGQFS